MDRKYMQFSISRSLLDNDPALVASVMEGMVVVRAESNYATDDIQYTAWHPKFPETRRGELIPHADLIIEKHAWGFGWKLDTLWGSYVK